MGFQEFQSYGTEKFSSRGLCKKAHVRKYSEFVLSRGRFGRKDKSSAIFHWQEIISGPKKLAQNWLTCRMTYPKHTRVYKTFVLQFRFSLEHTQLGSIL